MTAMADIAILAGWTPAVMEAMTVGELAAWWSVLRQRARPQ